jgi:succinate-semialdehyde dehydrogenase/glutarate-semialdehyde dehydrogenase
VFDRFVERFAAGAKALRVGDGSDPAFNMGPVANARRLAAMEEFVEDAVSSGANILTGGRRIGNRGFFFEPTVLTGVSREAKVMRLEPFGPLAPIAPFEEVDQVLEEANSLPYGLAAYAFTGSHRSAAHLSAGLRAGVVAVNGVTVTAPEAPFGGIGDSGLGREAGIEGLLEHTTIKTVVDTFN